MSPSRLLLTCALSAAAFAQTFSGAAAADEAIDQAIREKLIPGAVLLIGHEGSVVYQKAYGERSLVPKREPMTLDTIFDAASLTKVIATTSSLMKLFEQGKLRLNDPVTRYLPEFQSGKSGITVRDLMTHFSGLRPDLDLEPPWSGYDTGIKLALSDKPANPPGQRFVYSDINFILLGEIVHRLSGQRLSDFAREQVFRPLRMSESMFNPPPSLIRRIAPTEVENGTTIRGVVHDPTARYMNGVAGHAGLFTTAADLSKFAQMMLNGGELNGVRVFQRTTVEKFTTPQSPADQPVLRGLGWDIDSPFSGNRGELFPIGSYGHTGFTGTSLWIDPYSRTYVILLTNSVHPARGKNITPLRSRLATLVAANYGIAGPQVRLTGYEETIVGSGLHRVVDKNGDVMTGLDVLNAEQFAPLRGKRVGLITNHTGLSRDGRRNVDLMLAAGIHVAALFSPEHGLAGRRDDEHILSGVDERTKIPVYSLYEGSRRRPTAEMLKNLDTLVFDIQDVGARFYTYACTMRNSLEEAAKQGLEFVVMDRPNPITGVRVEGPMLDSDLESFVGCFDMPLRHGLTFGEMARMMNGELKLGAKLTVVPMKGWQRGDWWDATGLAWIDPSPNMRSLNAAALYPGLAMLEAARNYSVGRGTDAPFEQIGADWIHGTELSRFLNLRKIPGVRFYPTRFTPAASNFSGVPIEGVRMVITDRNALDSTRLGLEVGFALEKLYPGRMNFEGNRFLIGNRKVIDGLKSNQDPRIIVQKMEEDLRSFLLRRTRYLLY
jgi:uncharacterized protein YbbC (DUF1343 family)/CubicO group peptidase (beta-lactamase class C family)